MRLFIFVALIVIASCTNTSAEHGQRDIFDQSRVNQIQKGSVEQG